jgi:predicted phage terminase large subunit-like protein
MHADARPTLCNSHDHLEDARVREHFR